MNAKNKLPQIGKAQGKNSLGLPEVDLALTTTTMDSQTITLLCFALLRFLIKIRSICPTSTGLSSMSGPSPRRLGHVNGRGTYTGLASYASFPRCLRDKGGGNPTMDPF